VKIKGKHRELSGPVDRGREKGLTGGQKVKKVPNLRSEKHP